MNVIVTDHIFYKVIETQAELQQSSTCSCGMSLFADDKMI